MPKEEFDNKKLVDMFNDILNEEPHGHSSFSYFFSMIKGTRFEKDLMKTKYSLIKNKFSNILIELGRRVDDDYKIEDFINLINSIKGTRLLEEKITVILDAINEIKDSYVKRNIFDIMNYTIQGTHLMKENIKLILSSLEGIENDYERIHAFGTLIYTINGTGLVEENFTAILNILRKLEDHDLRRSAFYELNHIIGETPLLENRFVELFAFLNELPPQDKIYAVSNIINAIGVSFLPLEVKSTKYSLINTKFPTILNALNSLDDDIEKRRTLCNLMFSIRGSSLLELNFNAILDTVGTIRDETHKRFGLSYVISAIKGKKGYKEKLTVIKERFPQYTYASEEELTKKGN